jgi:hypothetical protein
MGTPAKMQRARSTSAAHSAIAVNERALASTAHNARSKITDSW